MSHETQSNHTHLLVTLTRRFGVIACLGMLAGVLIWAKLRLVTDIPRSAYAEPREVDGSTEDQENAWQDQSENLIDTDADESIEEHTDSTDSTQDSSADSIFVPKP